MRLRGIDHGTGEEELERAALADEPRQPLRRTVAGHDAELHFRLAELRPIRRDAQMAAHGELAASTERETVDRGERGLRRDFELPERALAALRARLSLDGVLIG